MDIGKTIKDALPVVERIAEVALTLAKIFPATAGIANAIEMGIKIEHGIAKEVPIILATYEDMKAAAAGGVAVSVDQWTAWEAQITEAHNEVQAAAARVAAS